MRKTYNVGGQVGFVHHEFQYQLHLLTKLISESIFQSMYDLAMLFNVFSSLSAICQRGSSPSDESLSRCTAFSHSNFIIFFYFFAISQL